MNVTNLPSRRSSLIGRDAEIEALADQLLAVPGRLVTVTGCGGAGKTSVATATARRVIPAFADGAWFVDLAGLRAADSIPGAIAAAVGLRERVDFDLTTDLRDFLQALLKKPSPHDPNKTLGPAFEYVHR